MRQIVRSLLKAREFTIIAVAIVGIGIGATTAVFSVVDAALLRPLPFRNADRLFLVSGTNPKRAIVDGPFSYPELTELRERVRLLDGLAGIAPCPGVDVGPGNFLRNEALKEQRRINAACHGIGGHIGEIRQVALQVFVIGLPQRHSPKRVLYVPRCLFDIRGKLIAIGEGRG